MGAHHRDQVANQGTAVDADGDPLGKHRDRAEENVDDLLTPHLGASERRPELYDAHL